MKLYFLRHGPALSRGEWDGADSDRPLSADGEAVVRSVARWIVEWQLGLDAILTSPYERALRTARIVEETLADGTPLVYEPGLEPGRFTLDSLWETASGRADSQSILLVGHEPSMSEVLSEVVGGGRYGFKKGGLARVDLYAVSPPAGELRWLVPPRLMR
jgi:phosphohistidine phosphatase